MLASDSRIPCRVEKFQSTFPKLRATSYLDPFRGPQPKLRSLAWSPLGNYVATGNPKTLRIWDAERIQAKDSIELKGHGNGVEQVAWNPLREAELASCSEGAIRIWDVRSKASVAEIKMPAEDFFTLSWTPDGTEILAGTRNNAIHRISRSRVSVVQTEQQALQTNNFAFSWSGRELFLTNGDGTIKVLDYPSLSPIYTFRAHTSSCFAIALSPNSRDLAVGGTDALITLWDTTNWICYRSLDRLTGPIRSVSFSWCGGYLVAGGEEDRGLEIVHVDSGECLHKIECGPTPIVQWSPRDYSLAYASHDSAGGLKIINGASLL